MPSFDAAESTTVAPTAIAAPITAGAPMLQQRMAPMTVAASAVPAVHAATTTTAAATGVGGGDQMAQIAALQQQILQMQASMTSKSTAAGAVKPPESALMASAAAAPIGRAGLSTATAQIPQQQQQQLQQPAAMMSLPMTSTQAVVPAQQQPIAATIHIGNKALTPNDISPQFAVTEQERVQRIENLSIDEDEDEITPGINLGPMAGSSSVSPSSSSGATIASLSPPPSYPSASANVATSTTTATTATTTTTNAPRMPIGIGKVDSHVGETADTGGENLVTQMLTDMAQPEEPGGDKSDASLGRSAEPRPSEQPDETIAQDVQTGGNTGNLRGSNNLSYSSTSAPPLELEGGVVIGPKSMGAFVESIQSCRESTKIVFLGDTTMAKLRQQPTAMDLLNAYGTANLAVEGYTIEQQDEFLRKLELHNLAHTHSVVVMVGAENLGAQEKADTVFDKIVAFVETVRQRFDTGTKLYLLTVLPRDSPGLNRAINSVNTRLNNKYKAYGMVKVIDLTSKFFDAAKGTLITSLYSGNNYHINKDGYTVIMELLLPMLGDVPKLATSESPICDMSILDTFAVSPTAKKDAVDLASDEATPAALAAAKADSSSGVTGGVTGGVTAATAVTGVPGAPTAQPTGGIIKLEQRVNPDRADGTSVKPVLHKRHAEFEPEILANLATYNSERTKLMLFGDSVFHKFGNLNLMPEFAPVNLASPSFHTEHVIMRITNLNLLPMRKVPVVALMVGGFNIGSKDSPEEVLQGILGVIKELKITFSRHTKIVVFSILPRNSLKLNTDIRSVNSALVAASDMTNSGFNFVDLTNRFVDENTMAIEEKMFEADKFSPSAEAMSLFKEVLVGVVEEAVAEAAATAPPTLAPTQAPTEPLSAPVATAPDSSPLQFDSTTPSVVQGTDATTTIVDGASSTSSSRSSLHDHDNHDHNQPEVDRERPAEHVMTEPGEVDGEEIVGGKVVRGKVRHKLTTLQYLKYQAIKYMPFLKTVLDSPTSHETIVPATPAVASSS